jgi:hypothetical protein
MEAMTKQVLLSSTGLLLVGASLAVNVPAARAIGGMSPGGSLGQVAVWNPNAPARDMDYYRARALADVEARLQQQRRPPQAAALIAVPGCDTCFCTRGTATFQTGIGYCVHDSVPAELLTAPRAGGPAFISWFAPLTAPPDLKTMYTWSTLQVGRTYDASMATYVGTDAESREGLAVGLPPGWSVTNPTTVYSRTRGLGVSLDGNNTIVSIFVFKTTW